MKIPFNVLQPCNKVLFAAKGGKIHSFLLADGAHLSTWKHPDVDRLAEARATTVKAEAEIAPADVKCVKEEDDGPPAKRQRVEDTEETKQTTDDGAMDVDEPAAAESKPQAGQNGSRDGKKVKQEKKARQMQPKGRNIARAPEQPLITHLLVTSSGSHLVAISGHDKTIWVFEHDGSGSLKTISQRTMPKRPCAAVVSPDNSTILSADKFGDVYTLPLVPSPVVNTPSSAPSTPATATQKAWKPEASNLTVHSARNLESLRQQKLQAEKMKKDGQSQDQPEKPTFEHTLIVGHVSLLTDLCLAEKDGRRYILTADRDEHIRVSRFIPQAHVIEGFCMGHRNFVNSMTVAAGRPEVLLSGGGDNEIYVWDWLGSKILSKFDLLKVARESSPGLAKIAVTQITTAVADDGQGGQQTVILVICEGIPALFVLSLSPTSSELKLAQVIDLVGNPFNLATPVEASGALRRILVATDAGESDSGNALVTALDFSAGGTTVDAGFQLQHASLSESEPDLTAEDVRKLLYGVEDLRKHSSDGPESDGEEVTEARAEQE